MAIERKENYNPLVFTEESKTYERTMNLQFYIELDEFARSHPAVKMIAMRDVRLNDYTGKYERYITFSSEDKSASKRVLEFYQDHFHYVPLDLISTVVSITDEEVHFHGTPLQGKSNATR